MVVFKQKTGKTYEVLMDTSLKYREVNYSNRS